MKLYRVQARHLGAYIDHQVSCDTEEQVIPSFINELNTGKVEIQQENLCQPKLCLITYEEINNGIKTSTTS